MFAFVSSSLLFATIYGSPAPADEPQRIAFLVRVNDYQARGLPDLRFAENDAKELADQLAKMGFRTKTLLGKEATGRAIEAELLRHLAGVNKKDVVVVSLCGHGV